MKILYVINSGKPGGVEQHVLDLTKSMNSLDHMVYVWCLPGEISKWYEEAGATVSTDKKIKFDFDPFYILDLASFIIREQVEVVHAHELKAGVNAIFASILSLAKVKITHIHTPMSEWQVVGTTKKLITKIQIFFYSLLVNFFSSREIALTESRKKVKMSEGVNENKIEVIPNALETTLFDVSVDSRPSIRREVRIKYNIPESAFLFGNIGRHTEEKGLDILIKAFADFANSRPNEQIYLLLAGGGRLEEVHKKLATNLGVEKKVIITGVFPDNEKKNIYNSLDAFVFPSRAEGFGIVLMEAMYTGLQVICSDLEVLREVGSDTIKYFRKDDSQDLFVKLGEVYNSQEKYNERARTRVAQEYSMEKFKNNYQNLYTKLAGDTK